MKKILFSIVLMAWAMSGIAQQEIFKWRLGVYGGDMAYFGDLNKRFFAPNPLFTEGDTDYLSYGASLERLLNKSWGVKVLYSKGRFTGNDVAYNWKNEILPAKSNFERALNFRTDVQDVSLLFTYYLDNDKFFGKRAFVSPYFSFGVGITDFEVLGDLFDQNGNRYFYWSDNTIRNLPEGSPDAQIIPQDGIFETNLTQLQTEGRGYQTNVLNIPLSIGFKFRMGNRLNLNLDFMMRYVFSDYIDDVSGKYLTDYTSSIQQLAGNPTNRLAIFRGNEKDNFQDIYTFTSLSLHYNFGKRSSTFQAPKIFASPLDNPNLDKSWVLPQDSIQKVLQTQPQLVLKDTLNQIAGKVENQEIKQKSKKKKNKKQKNQERTPVSISDTLLVKQKVVEQKDSIRINQKTEIRDTILQQKKVVIQTDTIQTVNNTLFFNPLADVEINKTSTNENTKTRQSEEDKVKKAEEEIRLLELEIKKKSLENELKMLQDLGNQANTPNNPSANPNEMPSNPQINYLNNQNYFLQERIKLEKERRDFYEEQLKKVRGQADLLRTQSEYTTNIYGNQQNPANFRQPDNQTIVSNYTLIPNQVTPKDSTTYYKINEQTLPPVDSLRKKQLDELNQKFDKVMNQLSQNRTQNQPNEAQNILLMNELRNLQNQINQLQNQVNQPIPQQNTQTNTNTPTTTSYKGVGKYEIFFASGVSQVSLADKQKLTQFIQKNIQNSKKMLYVVRGFTDKVGNPEQNLELSKIRANNVKAFLLANGILSEQIITEFYGVNYIGSYYNPNYERRVEVVILE